MTDFVEININNYSSDIKCQFFIDTSERILTLKSVGTCRDGSQGSIDTTLIYTSLVSYYFWLEPQVLILDFKELNYSFGNSILKLFNFTNIIGRDEYEKKIPMFFVISEKNISGISTLLRLTLDKLPNNFFYSIEEAVQVAILELEE